MPGKGHSPEQVLNKLRQVEVAVAGGKSVGKAVRGIGVTDHTYYRWRREYGGFSLPMARATYQDCPGNTFSWSVSGTYSQRRTTRRPTGSWRGT